MSLKKLVRWIRKSNERDFMKSRPLLIDNIVTFFSFSDEEKAFLSDVVSREIFIEIDRIGHDIVELANGHKTIGEIALLMYENYPKRYSCITLAEKEILNFFQMLYNVGLIKLMDYD